MVRLMPLPPVASCFDKIQIALTFLVPAYPNHLTKELVNWVSVVTQIIIVIMAALCNRGGALYFCPVVSFYLSFFFLFFPRLISAATDWVSTILCHMVWP